MNSVFNVQELLNGNIAGKYNDKIFWYASEVIIKDNQVNVYVNNENLVTFDDIELDIKKISEFINVKQKNKSHLKNVLVSSGSFLFINDKLVVTQRDLNTPFDPGFWTTPAGRCDRTIFETGIKETIEEIEIKRENKLLYPDIAKPFFPNNENIVFYKTSVDNKEFPLQTFNISLYLDDILISKCRLWMYISEEVNTIEFRIPIFANMPEKKITVTNAEYDTNACLKSINSLGKFQTVPALKAFINELDRREK